MSIKAVWRSHTLCMVGKIHAERRGKSRPLGDFAVFKQTLSTGSFTNCGLKPGIGCDILEMINGNMGVR